MGVFSVNKVPVTSINAVFHQQTMTTTIAATIFVANADVLRDIVDKVLNIKDVLEITRVTH